MFTNEHIKVHPSKSFSETLSLYNACNRILELNLNFDYLWKISGRYYMLDEFDIKNWPYRTSVIVSPMADDGFGNVNNVIYSVPKSMIIYYMSILQSCAIKCFNDNDGNNYGVENSLFDRDNSQVHEFLSIPAYIGGMCAVQDRIWWSC